MSLVRVKCDEDSMQLASSASFRDGVSSIYVADLTGVLTSPFRLTLCGRHGLC